MPRVVQGGASRTVSLFLLVVLVLPSMVALVANSRVFSAQKTSSLPVEYRGEWEAFRPTFGVCGNEVNPTLPKMAPLPPGTRKSISISADGQVVVLYESSAGALRRTAIAELVTEQVMGPESIESASYLVLDDLGEISLSSGSGGHVGPELWWTDSDGSLSCFRRKG